MKKNRLIALAIMLAAVIVISSAYAYFTDVKEVTNTFTVGDLEITLTEPEWPEPTDPLVPGDTYDKDPTITAVKGDSYMRVIMTIVDTSDADPDNHYVITDTTDPGRLAKILATLYYDKTGSNLVGINKTTPAGTLSTPYTAAQLAAKVALGTTGIETYFNSSEFVQHSAANGVYTFYYRDASKVATVGVDEYILKKDEAPVLFTNVVIPSDWSNSEVKLLGSYKIIIRAEAIQERGFANHTAAFAALDIELA